MRIHISKKWAFTFCSDHRNSTVRNLAVSQQNVCRSRYCEHMVFQHWSDRIFEGYRSCFRKLYSVPLKTGLVPRDDHPYQHWVGVPYQMLSATGILRIFRRISWRVHELMEPINGRFSGRSQCHMYCLSADRL